MIMWRKNQNGLGCIGFIVQTSTDFLFSLDDLQSTLTTHKNPLNSGSFVSDLHLLNTEVIVFLLNLTH